MCDNSPMRENIAVLLLLVSVIGCQAAPPTHMTQPWFAITQSPTGNPWNVAMIEKAHFNDSQWTHFSSVNATNGQTVIAPDDTNAWDIYVSYSTNTITGAKSDYGNIWTNIGVQPFPPTNQ
jgi:hypothetical protein